MKTFFTIGTFVICVAGILILMKTPKWERKKICFVGVSTVVLAIIFASIAFS